jgi:hypothetical protein
MSLDLSLSVTATIFDTLTEAAKEETILVGIMSHYRDVYNVRYARK